MTDDNPFKVYDETVDGIRGQQGAPNVLESEAYNRAAWKAEAERAERQNADLIAEHRRRASYHREVPQSFFICIWRGSGGIEWRTS